MSQSLTDWLQASRLTVIAVDRDARRIRLKDVADACSDLARRIDGRADGRRQGRPLNPGDVVRVEGAGSPAPRIVVVRRIWDELTSPEF